MSPALELHDVTVSYTDGDSQVKALDSVNLSIDPGEFVAVVGPSGSGKSTLLAVAGALTTPDSGKVLVAGEDIVPLSGAQLAEIRRNLIGFVFQSTSNLPSALTAEEHIELATKVIGKTGRYSSAELLDKVGMKHRAKHRPGSLSGGERQRVGIARALMGEPSLILADEPTAALDSERSHEIVALLRTLVEDRGIACGFVTHETELISSSDEVVRVADGKVTAAEAAIAA